MKNIENIFWTINQKYHEVFTKQTGAVRAHMVRDLSRFASLPALQPISATEAPGCDRERRALDLWRYNNIMARAVLIVRYA